MRWIHKKKEPDYIGKRRVVRKFLWFPTKLNQETRWLEFANVGQEFRRYWMCGPDMHPVINAKWINVQFIDGVHRFIKYE